MHVVTVAALLASAGCQAAAKSPALPSGWVRVSFADCCSIGLPRGASFVTPRDAIDSVVHMITDDKLTLSLEINDGPALPLENLPGRTLTNPEVAGEKSQDVAMQFAGDEKGMPNHHYLAVPIERGGKGRYINFQFRCRDDGCAVYKPLIDSIVITR